MPKITYKNPLYDRLLYSGFDQAGKTGYGRCFDNVSYIPEVGIAQYRFSSSPWKMYTKPVDPMQAMSWANAPSLGKYYNANVKSLDGGWISQGLLDVLK